MPGQATDATGVKILDAAARVLADHGVKRTTVEMVAKHAGVSHMTVYRRWPAKGELLQAAVLRELSMLIETTFDDAATRDTFEEKVFYAFSAIVWAVRNHPLASPEDPESDSPPTLTTTNDGSLMEAVVPMVAHHLDRIGDPRLGPGGAETLADVFVRLAHSLVVVRHPDHPLESRDEIDAYARRCVSVVIEPAGRASSEPVNALLVPAEIGAERGMGKRPLRPQLVAASLLAALLVGAGISAALVVDRGPGLSPDLVRSVQPQTSSATPTPAKPAPADVVETAAPVASEASPTTPPAASTPPPPTVVEPAAVAPTVDEPSQDSGGRGGVNAPPSAPAARPPSSPQPGSVAPPGSPPSGAPGSPAGSVNDPGQRPGPGGPASAGSPHR